MFDCRRAGAEQNPTDHIAPEEQVGILRSPLDFITIHPLCWDCKCWVERFGNYLLFFYGVLSRRQRPGFGSSGRNEAVFRCKSSHSFGRLCVVEAGICTL